MKEEKTLYKAPDGTVLDLIYVVRDVEDYYIGNTDLFESYQTCVNSIIGNRNEFINQTVFSESFRLKRLNYYLPKLNTLNEDFAEWIGASILGSLTSFE